ncbi:hypothetical protein ACH492_22215 [Streptomyces sp. NPDC019443]|uniref:hypothetical protein n=1 Tax=Streptomyces sp. NPDC019443 TaxID=3365061 RepID=UPI0037ACA3C2
MSMPEPYSPPQQAGQRHTMPGWSAPLVQPAQVELYGERRVAYVQSADNPNVSVAIDARLLQPQIAPQPRDLTPQPLLDPMAQRMGCGGILAAGVGWGGGQLLIGAGQLFNAAAAAGTVVAWIVGALIVARITSTLRSAGTHIHNEQHVHNHNKWWGKSTTSQ